MTDLLLGCGNNDVKKIHLPEDSPEWGELVRLDFDPDCKPDVLHNLNVVPWPLDSNMFDNVHAYEVLEHLGQQGDWRAFFDHFSEIWRVLKPGGHLFATSPSWDNEWAWGDPGHRRIISRSSLVFLRQESYADQVGKNSPMTDYRNYYKADFKIIGLPKDESEEKTGFWFVLQAIK